MSYFHPYLGKISNLTSVFSDGLVQPPTRCLCLVLRGCVTSPKRFPRSNPSTCASKAQCRVERLWRCWTLERTLGFLDPATTRGGNWTNFFGRFGVFFLNGGFLGGLKFGRVCLLMSFFCWDCFWFSCSQTSFCLKSWQMKDDIAQVKYFLDGILQHFSHPNSWIFSVFFYTWFFS